MVNFWSNISKTDLHKNDEILPPEVSTVHSYKRFNKWILWNRWVWAESTTIANTHSLTNERSEIISMDERPLKATTPKFLQTNNRAPPVSSDLNLDSVYFQCSCFSPSSLVLDLQCRFFLKKYEFRNSLIIELSQYLADFCLILVSKWHWNPIISICLFGIK